MQAAMPTAASSTSGRRLARSERKGELATATIRAVSKTASCNPSTPREMMPRPWASATMFQATSAQDEEVGDDHTHDSNAPCDRETPSPAFLGRQRL